MDENKVEENVEEKVYYSTYKTPITEHINNFFWHRWGEFKLFCYGVWYVIYLPWLITNTMVEKN